MPDRPPTHDPEKVHSAQGCAATCEVLASVRDRVIARDALAAAVVEFQKELPRVAKKSTATIPGRDGKQGYSYTYADLADLSDQATPVLVRHGLSFTCAPRQAQGGGYELVGILRHTSGQCDEGAIPLQGRTAQELGSSITYARRYLFGAMTGIVTDDDDDGQRAQAAQGPATTDRRPAAMKVWHDAQEDTTLEKVQAHWREASAQGLLGVEIEHLDGAIEPLGNALRRLGDTLAGKDGAP